MTGVAVIGAGHWGSNHARIYKELLQDGTVSKVKICDWNEASLSKITGSLALEGVTDYRQLLNDPSIQSVSIATPSLTHYRIAREFMEAGKDVLVEKPITMDIREATELVDVSIRTNRILMAGHLFRYHPAVQELKRRIDKGDLGTIQIMMSQRFAFGLPRRDMGVIWALGIHELDMFCYLLNVDYPEKLTAVASAAYSRDIEETVMIAMDFGTAKGYALESWLVPVYGKKRDLAVVGSRQSAKIDYLKPAEICLHDAKFAIQNGIPVQAEDKGETRVSIPYGEPLKEELKYFLGCVKTRQKPLSDGLVGLRAVVMAEAALASAKTGKTVKFQNGSYQYL